MLFNIEHDSGPEITGYLVPDGFSSCATVLVIHAGQEVLRKQTHSPREALVTAGRHETGLCGFTLDESELPGLSTFDDLELRDADTDLLIYRRCAREPLVLQKVFRFETHLFPMSRIDRAMQPRFHYYFPRIERFGLETSQQTFLMSNADSVYISGRVSYRSVEYFLDQGYSSIGFVQDPYTEMAERILVLRIVGKEQDGILGIRDNVVIEAMRMFARSLQLDSEKELRRAFRDASPEVQMGFADPLVRQLTCRTSDEAVKPSSISQALSMLSQFRVLGLRHRPELFAEALTDAFSLNDGEIPVVQPIPAARELGNRLKSVPAAERFLENDLALFHFVEAAFEKSLVER
jgi:hypothetical protein